jgi:hypothetical protein
MLSETMANAQGKSRVALPESLIKYFKLDIKVSTFDKDYISNFPLKRVPAFLGSDGFKLTEAIAVDLYRKSIAVTKVVVVLYMMCQFSSYPCLNNRVENFLVVFCLICAMSLTFDGRALKVC